MKKTLAHIFISYSHVDAEHRSRVVERLRAEKIPYWYDDDAMEPGKWKPQIDVALEEAFAVIVIVTAQSMKSLYVTYEWSWALGCSIPVFPLLVAGRFDDVHPRLLDEHCFDCRKGIPDEVLQKIDDTKKTPPDTSYLNDLIRKQILPLQLQILLVIWIESRLGIKTEACEPFNALHQLAINSIEDTYFELINLLVRYSHAFTHKHKRYFRELIDLTNELKVKMPLRTWRDNVKAPFPVSREEYFQWLENFYTNRWAPSIAQVDDKYTAIDAVTEYLYGKSEQAETTANRKVYERYFKGRISEEEFFQRSDEEREIESQMTENVTYSLLRASLGSEEFTIVVWKLISSLLTDRP